MKNYGIDEHTPLTKTLPPDYVYMTNPNRLYRKQVHQFQCCICAVVLAIFTIALAITILYSVDADTIDIIPPLPSDNASLQLLLSKSWPLPDDSVPEWQVASPTPEELEAAVQAGKAGLAERDKLEAANPSLPVNSPSYRHQVSIKTSARATNLARSAYIMEVATKTFVLNKSKSKNLTKTVGRGPMLTTDWLPSEECGVGPLSPCPPSKYRTVDGSCNNLYKPNKWGVAMRPYRRQLAQAYADGISKPRLASDGSLLPSARDVSVTVHRPAYRDDPKFTVMLAVWGQFMDHDVTATAISLGAGGKPISCCQNNSTFAHPECFSVHLSEDDTYYKQFGITCMEFVRSAPAATCALGPREQLNQVSSYLDASVVYGNTPELARALRSYQSGQMKMLETPDGRTLLPISTNLDDGCNREAENAKGRYCFMTGDARANENTHLTSLHLLMARQHNLLASQLADINPDWSDEKLYQETRKIVAAQMQHITYNEFLPVLLGPDMMEELELSPKESGYYKNYDPSVDATISNNFASSSFRFAHTLLPALMKTVAKDWGSEESVEMHKMLFDPYKLYQTGALDKVLQGAIATRLERADSYFNTQVTQHLFQATGEDDKPSAPRYGLDLVSLNVQRGRDHGLPAYPAWREFCGLKRPKTFEDMEGMVDKGSLEKMKAIYKSVDDIDMYTGALSEFPVEGGLVGPTVTCLVSDQFKRLKQGDSFWYETNKQPQAFSLPQLDEIRKTTLASIICDTSDDVTTVQPQVMRSVSPDNSRVPCSAISKLDITKWMENFIELKKSSSVGIKSSKIGITVTGGTIKTSSGDVLWDGTLPVAISRPPFAVKKASSVASSTGVFGHGVQWQGSTLITSDGLEVSGTFSYPVFAHGPIPLGTNYSVKWVNGEFKLTAVVTFNDTDLSSLSLPGAYESPIYFSQEKTNETVPKQQFVLNTVQDDAPIVIGDQKLPVILIGSNSPDKTSFDWTGKAIITVPSTPTPPKLLSPTTPEKTLSSGAFNVISGSVKLQYSDGSSANLWSGGFPVAIPLPLPYKVLMAGGPGEKLPIFGSGLQWSASVSGTSLEGSFSFPQYNRTFGFVSVNWFSGQFSLDVAPLEGVTLEELVTPGVKYTSSIIFRQEPVSPYLQLKNLFDNDVDAPDSLENLMVESQQIIDGTIPAPLILYGTFSPDKTFYFNGKIILAVRPTKPKIDQQLKLLKSPELSLPPWASPKYGGFVNSGFITAGLDGGLATTIWAGTVPVAIPMPTFFSPIYDSIGGKSFIFGNGVVWSGTLSGSTVKGTFSLPQTVKSLSGITLKTWTGEFSFEVSPLWNATLDSIFVSGAKYYSKIHFQGTKYDAGINSLKGIPGEDPTVTMSAPIILQGSYSLDKTTFYWSGNFIIMFRNKPILAFTIPKKPVTKTDPTKSNIALDITSGSIVAGFTGSNPTQVWSGQLPLTIPYSSLISKDSWSSIPSPTVMWTGEVKDDIFQGSFAVPTYRQNGTAEVVEWWSGNFSFKYVSKYGQLLEDYVRAGKKYNFKVALIQSQKSSFEINSEQSDGGSKLVQFTQAAQEVLDDSKPGKLVLFGNYYSKPFYCYIIPFCSEKKEYYWSGSVSLSFKDPAKNNTVNELNKVKMNDIEIGKPSSQFAGKVVSGSVEGSLNGENNNWWTGNLPVEIPTSIFWTNNTKAAPGLIGSHKINWSGTLIGNTLKGSFSFPQMVLDYPVPSVRLWSGQFSFEVEPLWNATLDGLIQSEVEYSSGIYFQGVKVVKENDDTDKLVVGDSAVGKQSAPIILQGTLSPDGSTFLWSGNFIISVKNYPFYSSLTLTKTKDDSKETIKAPKLTKPAVSKPTKPKTTVSFTVITGQMSATNGSDPVQLWGGEMPLEINTNIFNPSNTPGSGVSINWSPSSLSPQLTGSFSVSVFTRNGSVLLPVQWSGNFSFHYVIKWSGSFEGLVKPGKQYTCSVMFKDTVKSTQQQAMEEYTYEQVPERFVLGVGASSGTPCTLILSGKTYVKSGNAFYCKIIPFICSNKPDTTWFVFNGDALLIIKPQTDIVPEIGPEYPKSEYPESENPKSLSEISTVKPAKPKTSVSFTVITGQMSATNGSDPVQFWGGQMPIEINTNFFNPLNTPGAGVSINWSPSSLSPQLTGTFSVSVFARNGSILLPVQWSGNFSFHYIIKWSGSFEGLVMPGKQYTCSVMFKDIVKSTQQQAMEEYIDEQVSERFILGAGASSGTPCTLILNGKSYVKKGNSFYCKFMPFMCSNEPDTTWFVFNGDALLIIKPQTDILPEKLVLSKPKPTVSYLQSFPRRVNTTVLSGSIVAGPESEYPKTLWSGTFPVSVPLPVFWSSDVTSKGKVPPEDPLHVHGVIWSGSQMGPRLEGSFSLPQYSKTGIKWWTGRFSLLLKTNWGSLGDLDELITPGVNYKSRIIFRDIYTPAPLLAQNQFDIDTATDIPIILLGNYALDKKTFYWSGDVIFAIRNNHSYFVEQATNLQLLGGDSSDASPTKPKQRVGVLISSVSVTNKTGEEENVLWSGSIPATIPLSKFNISKGVNVIWSASTLYPKFSGRYSVPQFVNNEEGYKIEWLDGKFSFDLTTLWNTSLDVIEVGKEYATVIGSSGTKWTKAEEEELLNSFEMLIMESAELLGAPLGKVNLKGVLTPDQLNFIWQGEAWFYLGSNKTLGTKANVQLQKMADTPLYLSQFGGAVYDGSVTTGTSSFFSFTHTIWNGNLPATIPFSSFWSGSFFEGVKFTRSITWTASSVSDSLLAGSYSVPQYSWDGITTSVTWYKGNFKFHLRPLWNATLASLIQPGVQYYSRISFQGEKPLLEADADTTGIPAPIILQGTYSPDRASFFWSGNFILNVK